MANLEIRQAIAKKRLKHFEVAKALGITQTYFSHLLQTELPEERKEQILNIINNFEF